MQLTDIEWRGLPVETVTGQRVGKLVGVTLDTGSHAIAYYAVVRARLLAPLLPQELLIRPSQVVSIDADKMVVGGEVLVEERTAAVVREAASGLSAAMRREG